MIHKKVKASIYILTIVFAFIATSCNKNNVLDAQGYMFYVMDGNGNKIEMPDANFYKSQTIMLYLYNIGPFKATDNKSYKANMDIEILHNHKKRVFKKENYLGENDYTIDQDTIPFLYAVWQANPDNKAGEYTFKVRIKDRVSGHKTMFEPKFNISED